MSWISLVGIVGGTLGMFVGFSFVTSCEWIVALLDTFWKLFKFGYFNEQQSVEKKKVVKLATTNLIYFLWFSKPPSFEVKPPLLTYYCKLSYKTCPEGRRLGRKGIKFQPLLHCN